MKTLTLTLACFLSALLANAQWSINLQGGPQKISGFNRVPAHNTNLNYDNAIPSTGITIGAYIVTEREKAINMGIGVSFRTNQVHRYAERYDEYYNSQVRGVYKLEFDHKSAFVSIHPLLDVNLDENKYFHLLLNPVISFFAGGGETGYRSYTRDTFSYRVDYVNSTDRIKKFVLGFSAQLQFQYPLTERLKPVLALGYSINNSPGDFVPTETGTFSFQAGLKYRFELKKRTEGPKRAEAPIE